MEKKVLIGVDGSLEALNAVRYVADMFRADPEFTVSLIYVLPALPEVLFEEEEKLDKYQRAYKAKLEEKYQKEIDAVFKQAKDIFDTAGWEETRVETVVTPRHMGLSKELLFFAEHNLYDALVLGWRNISGLERIFKSSVSEEILHSSKTVPIWFVPAYFVSPKVLLALDGSPSAMRAVDHVGFILSGRADIEVTLFHVASRLEKLLFMKEAEEMLVKAGVPKEKIKRQIVHGGDIATQIIGYQRQHQISTIAMGRRGISKIKSFFWGSVSIKITENLKRGAIWIVD